jgi:hypothetical protein
LLIFTINNLFAVRGILFSFLPDESARHDTNSILYAVADAFAFFKVSSIFPCRASGVKGLTM